MPSASFPTTLHPVLALPIQELYALKLSLEITYHSGSPPGENTLKLLVGAVSPNASKVIISPG